METMVLRSAIQYDREKEGFTVTEQSTKETKEIKLSYISQTFGSTMFEEHKKFVTSFNDAADGDKPTMMLAMIINLFAPDRPQLVRKEVVAKAEEKYCHLLQAYLRSKYSSSKAECMLPKILMKLTDVRNYGVLSAEHMSQLSGDSLLPLLQEVFAKK